MFQRSTEFLTNLAVTLRARPLRFQVLTLHSESANDNAMASWLRKFVELSGLDELISYLEELSSFEGYYFRNRSSLLLTVDVDQAITKSFASSPCVP